MDRKSYTELDIKETEKGSETFQCPNCKTHLQFRVRVKVAGVYEQGLSEEERAAQQAEKQRRRGSDGGKAVDHGAEARARLIEQWKREGIFRAFEETLKIAGLGQRLPADTEDALLLVMQRAAPILVPKLAVRRLLNEFGPDNLEVYAASGMSFIVSSGKLRCFIPQRMLTGELVRAARGGSVRLRVKADEDDLDVWFRGRHGYVVGGGAYAAEMSKKSAGDFAKASGNS